MARTARALAKALVAAALLTGCGTQPDDDGGRSQPPSPGEATPAPTTPAASPSASPSPGAPVVTAEAVRSDGAVVQAGGRTVLHAVRVGDATISTAVEDADVTVLTVDPGAPGTPVAVLLAAPADGTLTLLDDGSLVILAADGTFLGGAARPVTADGSAPVTVVEAGDGVVRATADDGVLQLRVGAHALAGAEWDEREGGRSLAVTPTPWARGAGQAGEVGVWTELVAAVPEADTPVMRDQLTCHALGAADKETWNLEPWRPDVGLIAVLAAACNPA